MSITSQERKTLDVVNDHAIRAYEAEQRWKERFYDWELMFFMRYKKADVATETGEEAQKRSPRSMQYIGYAHAQVETAVAKSLNSIFGKWPPFEVFPEGGFDMEAANEVKALHSWSLRRDRMYRKTRQALRFYYIYGTVVWKHMWGQDWVRQGERIPVEVEGVNDEGLVWRYEVVRRPKMLYEGPMSYVVDPYYFHIDPMAEDIVSARWVQEEFVRSERHIRDLQRRGIYRRISLDGISPHNPGHGPRENYRKRRQDVMGSTEARPDDADSDDLVPGLYDLTEETHDDRLITVIGPPGGAQRVLRDQPNPYFHGRKPYTEWRYIDIANEFWGLPLSRQVEGPQQELNMIRRMRSDALLTNLRRMWRMSPAARTKIKKTDLVYRPDGIVVAEKDELEPLPVTNLDIFSYKEEEILRADGDITTGITDIARGQAAPSMTATVGAINANFATDRLSMTMDNIADGYDEILHMRHQLYQQFADTAQVVQATGPQGLRMITVPIERIRGEYSFRFVAGRGMAQREVQRTQLLSYLTIAAQNPMIAMRTNFDNLIHDIVASFDALPDPSRYLLGSPVQSIPQEQELLVMLTGVPMPVNTNDDHMQHLQVLAQFVESPQWEELPDEYKQLIEAHGKEHIPFAQNMMAAQMGPGNSAQSGSPDRPGLPTGAATEGEAMKAIRRENAPKVYMQ